MESLVIMKDKQAVTTSIQIAESFNKQHKHVLEAIENKMSTAENSALLKTMFHEDSYRASNGKTNKMYFMNRDGFTFIAFGFTGVAADEFKLKYINAFNRMEAEIKQQFDTSNLSPELQMFGNIFKSLARQESLQKELESKVDNISNIVALNTVEWRKDAQNLINKIAKLRGNTGEVHKEIRSEIFNEVDRRGGVQLSTRLTNKRRRMAEEGINKTKRERVSKVDVIAEDKKLIEIYVAIVKEYAVKYGASSEIYLNN